MLRAIKNKNDLTILLYHGVTSDESIGIENYSHKHIQRNHFLEQMEFVKKKCRVLSIDEIVEINDNNANFPVNAVAITFDDGFRNNYTIAAPILDELALPAAFYVSSGVVNTNIMFWVDILEDCINQTSIDCIKIQLEEKCCLPLSTRLDKIRSLERIKQFCKTIYSNEKDDLVKKIITQTKVTPDITHARNYQKLDWQEVIELSNSSLFTIGGHSMYHDILSKMTVKKMESDITLSVELLKYHLKQDIRHYSYPEGQLDHYNQKVIDDLKKNGIKCSPSAISGFNPKGTDLFHLKRIMVGLMNTKFPYAEFS